MMREGLDIFWDPAIDGGAWPGPLTDGRDAAMDEAWLGPLRLLDRLELELGLGGIHASPLERATALAARLATHAGWWSESFANDPHGTARRLLRDRDQLALAGWRGEDLGTRLNSLWRVTVDTPAGIAERLHAIHDALSDRATGIASLTSWSPLGSLPVLWRQVFARLAASGVAVIEAATSTAPARGDLARSRTIPFAPEGDGTLILLRAQGPLAAADEVAAHLAAMTSLDGVVVVGGDGVLDAALSRHGLPRLGAAVEPPASTALVRLVIEAAFEPMEPGDLHALLCLDPGPVPRRVADRLVAALGSLPSRRSQTWRAALEDGLARCDDTWREDVRARLDTLLVPAAARSASVAVDEIDRRLGVVTAWARARMTAVPSLAALAAIAAEARHLVCGRGASTLSLVALRTLCDDLYRVQGAGLPAQAGIAAVTHPGAILDRARHVVWWRFTRDRAPVPARFRLTREEREQLRAHGIEAPDVGAEMEAEARRWRRPLELASEGLILVCPSTSDAGERAFPHPLWDELVAAMAHPRHAAILERPQLPGVVRRAAALRPLPVPATKTQVSVAAASALVLRAEESPSSLESLLGCPLGWALHYHGRLRGGCSAAPPQPAPLVYGSIAHRVLAAVFGDGALDSAAAGARAEAIVDAQLAELCEPLALPRHQLARSTVRQAIVDSARVLGRLLETSGATVHAVERTLTGVVGEVAIAGTPDLVLANPDVVIDLKWGRSVSRDKIQNGSALQLAIYAHLRAADGAVAMPEVAYFTLQSQELFAPVGSTLPDARCPGDATPRSVFEAALVTLGERRRQLARGELLAPAADGSEIEPGLHGAQLSIAPACGYCSFATLCGQGACE